METLERDILGWITSLGRAWPPLDRAVLAVVFNDLVKGAVPLTAFWWAWWRAAPPTRQRSHRARLLAALMGTAVALGINRTLAVLLPFRPRPRQCPELSIPHHWDPLHERLLEMSAFPSDHAVLFFGMSMALWGVSKRAGWLLLVHALVLVSFPRVYLGFHWPSDIVGGAALALGVLWVFQRPRIRRLLTERWLHWSETAPGSFAAGLFLVTFLFATLFEGIVGLVLSVFGPR